MDGADLLCPSTPGPSGTADADADANADADVDAVGVPVMAPGSVGAVAEGAEGHREVPMPGDHMGGLLPGGLLLKG